MLVAFLAAGDGTSTYDAALAGWDLACYDNNDWQANQQRKNLAQMSTPDGDYNTAATFASKPTSPLPPASY